LDVFLEGQKPRTIRRKKRYCQEARSPTKKVKPAHMAISRSYNFTEKRKKKRKTPVLHSDSQKGS
jgi:hypothetical protein